MTLCRVCECIGVMVPWWWSCYSSAQLVNATENVQICNYGKMKQTNKLPFPPWFTFWDFGGKFCCAVVSFYCKSKWYGIDSNFHYCERKHFKSLRYLNKIIFVNIFSISFSFEYNRFRCLTLAYFVNVAPVAPLLSTWLNHFYSNAFKNENISLLLSFSFSRKNKYFSLLWQQH